MMFLRSPVGNGLIAALSRLPRLVRGGGAMVVAGGVVDILYHSAPSSNAGSQAMALPGHAVTLAGMAVAMVGVVRAGLAQRQRQPR